MKRKISLFICAFAMMLAVLAAGAFAQTYVTNDDGLYSLPFTFEANNEYIAVVVKGHYDQTNYIEAYFNADDSDILYFEQKESDENGNVTFGPFVPNGYYDATVIVGGATLEEPYLAGYLSVEGISNSARIEISGLEQVYTVAGFNGSDISAEIEVEVFDSFGYPSVTNEEVKIELYNNDEGVSLEGNTLLISKMAKAQTFLVKASAGDAVKAVYVQVNREPSAHRQIRVYTDEACEKEVYEIIVKGLVGAFEPLTVYAKSYDQYDEEIEDEFQFVYGGKTVGQSFVPTLGVVSLTVSSKNSGVVAFVYVNAVARPDYQGSALELFELIKTANEKLSEKVNFSVNGKDVYAEETWTTREDYDTFASAVATAESALNLYGTDGYGDSSYSDEVKDLTKAINEYNKSFSAGRRVDATSVKIDLQDIITTANTTVAVKAVTEPNLGLTTEELVWSSSDESVATVSSTTNNGGTAEIRAKASGKATITVTTRNGLTATTEITVVKKASEILLETTSTTATYGEEPVILKATIKPTGCTDVITWTVDKPELADLELNEYIDDNNFRIIEATVVPKSSGKVKITVNAQYGQKSASKEITIKMQDWSKAVSPVASVESGFVLPGTKVSLSSETANAQIYYTLDGTEPSRTNGRLYRAPIVVNQSLVLKAVAVGDEIYDSDVVTYKYDITNTRVSITSGTVKKGEEVGIAINVSGFENIAYAVIDIDYDNSAISSDSFSWNNDYAISYEMRGRGFRIHYSDRNGALSEGELMHVFFRADDAPEGKYVISIKQATVISYDESLGNLGEFEAAKEDGAITVRNFILGDANNDGEIGLADVLIIKQCLAGNETAKRNIVLDAADTDGDGDVDNDDVILLSKYCVGWDVKFGEKSEFGYAIVSNYDIGIDDDGAWRYFYEVYDPAKATKLYDIPSAVSSEKASTLPESLETGEIVRIFNDGSIDESKPLGTVDFANLVWIKSADNNSMTVVPFDDAPECKTCANAYIETYNGTAYNDIFGNTHESNVVKVTEDTKFSVIKYSSMSSFFLKWGTMNFLSYSDITGAKKNALCYNENSLDSDENYKTTYSSYVKAFVCVNDLNEAEFVLVVVNGNEAAAYNVPCENCNN